LTRSGIRKNSAAEQRDSEFLRIPLRQFFEEANSMHLTGFQAIEFAEKHNLPLYKKGDRIDEYAEGLTIAEAEAIADEDESLIFLNVPDEDYYGAAPSSFEPER
jgi:hypothetical protein